MTRQFGGLSLRVQFSRGIERIVGLARVNQLRQVAVVNIQSLALKVRTVRTAAMGTEHRTLVPADSKPCQVLQESNACRVARSLLVGVLDTEQEGAALPLGIGPAEQSRACAAHMQVTGRGGSEASDAGGGRHERRQRYRGS